METISINIGDVIYREDLYPRVKPEDSILNVTLSFLETISMSASIVNDVLPMSFSLKNKKYRDAVISFFGNKCFVCGYRSFIDIHHVTHKTKTGTDRIENLVVLCPNHHKEWHYIENTFFASLRGKVEVNARGSRAISMDWFIPDFVMRNNIAPFLIRLKIISEGTQA